MSRDQMSDKSLIELGEDVVVISSLVLNGLDGLYLFGHARVVQSIC
jgi:hypothetical protein